MIKMSFLFNNIPALSEESIETMKKLREKIIGLKEEAYGNDCNKYGCSVDFYPKNMTLQELEKRLHEIFPNETLRKLAEEQKALRSKIDYELAKVVATEILPLLAPSGTLFRYDLYVAARDMSQIDSKIDPHRGRKDRQTQIVSLSVEDWRDGAWKEYIFSDNQADSEEIQAYMPVGTNRLLSTVHRFYVVNKTNKNFQRKNKNHNNGFLPGHEINESKLQVDFRTKSGAELSYKFVSLLTGIERKPNEPREDVRDLAGARIVFKDDYEENSIDCFRYFMNNYRGSCEGSLILQILHPNHDEQKSEFLKNLPRKSKGFCEAILDIEDRTNILDPEDVKKIGKKYYLEMLIPFFTTCYKENDVFGRNIINLITQPSKTYKKILEKRDHFIYKGRLEDDRERAWTFLDWYLLKKLAPEILTGDSLSYINEVTQSYLSKKMRKMSQDF